jgi:hypothetical protein
MTPLIRFSSINAIVAAAIVVGVSYLLPESLTRFERVLIVVPILMISVYLLTYFQGKSGNGRK